MCGRLATLVELRERTRSPARLIAGLHIEGPFINEADGYRGAHPRDAIRPADVDAMKRLLDAAGGLTRIVTLAPERDAGFAVTRLLAAQGVVVSAGHSDASLDQLRGGDRRRAVDVHAPRQRLPDADAPPRQHHPARARACPTSSGSASSPTARTCRSSRSGNYLRLAGLRPRDRRDRRHRAGGAGAGAVHAGAVGPAIGDDMVARAPDGSHLVGSAITMPQSDANLRDKLQLPESAIRTLTRDNPRAAIGA